MAECITCEEEYTDKRLELGYMTCLNCGQADAVNVINTRNKKVLAEIAPAAAASGEFDNHKARNDWSDEEKEEEESNDENR
mgnify:CR=1 FL=1